ncbi:MAG: hypothetical protein IJ493_13470 [Clostridia bacterium]|nr:hypothetical protein [Clostridia bacterium]
MRICLLFLLTLLLCICTGCGGTTIVWRDSAAVGRAPYAVDLSTGERHSACPMPNCTHQVSSCAFHRLRGEMLADGSRLVYFAAEDGTLSGRLDSLHLYDADGGTDTLLLTVPGGELRLAAEGWIYYDVPIPLSDGYTTFRISANGGEPESIRADKWRLVDIEGGRMLWESTDGLQYEEKAYAVESDKCALSGGKIYYLRSRDLAEKALPLARTFDGRELHVIDPKTGKDEFIASAGDFILADGELYYTSAAGVIVNRAGKTVCDHTPLVIGGLLAAEDGKLALSASGTLNSVTVNAADTVIADIASGSARLVRAG